MGELVLEGRHQPLKRAVASTYNRHIHENAVHSAVLNDLQGRISLTLPEMYSSTEHKRPTFLRIKTDQEALHVSDECIPTSLHEKVLSSLRETKLLQNELLAQGVFVFAGGRSSSHLLAQSTSCPSADMDPLALASIFTRRSPDSFLSAKCIPSVIFGHRHSSSRDVITGASILRTLPSVNCAPFYLFLPEIEDCWTIQASTVSMWCVNHVI